MTESNNEKQLIRYLLEDQHPDDDIIGLAHDVLVGQYSLAMKQVAYRRVKTLLGIEVGKVTEDMITRYVDVVITPYTRTDD